MRSDLIFTIRSLCVISPSKFDVYALMQTAAVSKSIGSAQMRSLTTETGSIFSSFIQRRRERPGHDKGLDLGRPWTAFETISPFQTDTRCGEMGRGGF